MALPTQHGEQKGQEKEAVIGTSPSTTPSQMADPATLQTMGIRGSGGTLVMEG